MHPVDPAALTSFLVIRRDNIGDLVCTLPLIAALRAHFPAARIEALVNSYNRDVLVGHPNLDTVHAYSKGKHREGESLLSVYARRARLLWNLRGQGLDCAVLAAPDEQPRALGYARLIGARHVLGYVRPGHPLRGVDLPVVYQPQAQAHEVEKVFALLAPLGVTGTPPAARLTADPTAVMRMRAALARLPGKASAGPLVALHISARKPSQRWPIERFAALGRALCARHGARLLLLWAPGDEANRLHPGDDGKAAALTRELAGLPVLAYGTAQLADLIAALAACDSVICADGGAMHLAAALGKPIVALFGDSDAARWRPWGVPYRLLQMPSREVRDIGAEAVLTAWEGLAAARSAAP
jgi:ADP-heptose:LPS heptosyltransferase